MPSVSDLRSKLTLNTTDFMKKIDKANNQANTFSRKLAKSFQSVNKESKQATREMSTFAEKASSSFKDVTRIIQGILVSQLFYRLIGQVQDLTREMFNLSMEVEQARVSFAGLLGEAELAGVMLKDLEDFTARTPFTYTQVTAATRKLMAYGYEAENILPVLEGIADAVAVDGRLETWDRLALAFGQIKGKGRLMGQEMRQMHDAGIPAAQILQEELGILSDDVANIGRLNIDADTAIRALLDGINKRFEGASVAMSRTLRGLMTTMKDNFLLLGSEMTEPIYENIRNFVYHTTERLKELREVARHRGIGGVFEEIMPPEALDMLRAFIANIRMIRDNLKLLVEAVKPVVRVLGGMLVTVFNTINPFIQMFLRVLISLVHVITHASGLIRGLGAALIGLLVANLVIYAFTGLRKSLMKLFIVKALGQAIIWLVQAFRMVILFATTSATAFLGVAAAVAGLIFVITLGSAKITNGLRNAMASVKGFFGYDPNDILQPKMEEATETTANFNEKLEAGESKLDDMGKAAEKAGKKAVKGLQAFDEVFTINDPDETGSGSGSPDFGEMFDDMEEALPMLGDVEFPMPEFEDKITGWVDEMTGTLRSKLKTALIGAGIGALVGGLIGTFLLPGVGTVLGAKIGAAAGAIAGFFWEDLKEEMTPSFGIKIGLGAVVGGVLGSALGPAGTMIGAAVGAAAVAVATLYWEKIEEHLHPSFGTHIKIGMGIGGALGLMLGPKGMIVGMAIGGAAAAIVSTFWEELSDHFDTSKRSGKVNQLSATLGLIIGTAIMPGPGSVIGLAIGVGAGAIVNKYWGELKKAFTSDTAGAAMSGATVGAILGTILFPGPGTLIGAAVGGAAAAIADFFWEDIRGAIIEFAEDTVPRIKGWVTETGENMDRWVEERGEEFDTWVGEQVSNFKGWARDTKADITNWDEETTRKLRTWTANRKTDFANWRTNTWGTIKGWSGSTKIKLGNWVTDTKAGFKTWKDDNIAKFEEFWSGTKLGISTWTSETLENMKTWAEDVYNSVMGWWNDLMESLEEFWDTIKFWENDNRDKEVNLRINEEIHTTHYGSNGGNDSKETKTTYYGRANGGIFNKEHIAHFAEGNKMEAILPVENPAAMEKVRRAIFGGDPMEFFNKGGSGGGGESQQPVFQVGTLIADDRGLRELNRRFELIQQQEGKRKGGR